MTASRFPNAPPQIAALKVDARGFPVPWFVSWINGEPEFRAVEPRKVGEADRLNLCWVCGKSFAIGGLKTFVVGPMCTVNRISPEPPLHLDCARFSVQACPFLSKPLAKRRPMEGGDWAPPAGEMIERNPGVTALWIAASYRHHRDGGMLFRLGTPRKVEWWTQGRRATRDEVLESINSGLPILREMAMTEGVEACRQLDRMTLRALKLVPLT